MKKLLLLLALTISLIACVPIHSELVYKIALTDNLENEVIESYKKTLKSIDYIEGKNVEYTIYSVDEVDKIKANLIITKDYYPHSEAPVIAYSHNCFVNTVKSIQEPEGHITGIMNKHHIQKLLDYLLKEKYKKIGIVYDNDYTIQVNTLKIPNNKVSIYKQKINNQNIMKDIDILVLLTSHDISNIITKYKNTPIISHDLKYLDKVSFVYDVNQQELGKQLAVMSDKMLIGEANIKEMPIETIENFKIYKNEKH